MTNTNPFRKPISTQKNKKSKVAFYHQISALLILFFLVFLSYPLSAQQSFTPLKQGEYEIREEKIFFNPGIQFNGSYEAAYTNRKKGLITGSNLGGQLFQDIELGLRSRVNTNLSLHATIGTKSTIVPEQEEAYSSTYPDENSDSTTDNGMDLVFREAYLEYNHNPNAILKMGRQFINVGDQMGLIYQGNANAISQKCRIGTWCYYVGGARIGNEGSSSLFWGQIDYPVYESGVVISDKWEEKGTRQQVSFNVELMRVMYRGIDIPVSKSGIWTGEGSSSHDNSGDTYYYFDNNGLEYIGFNLDWNYYDFMLNLSWLYLDGKREYYSHKLNDADKAFLATQQLSGNAYHLDAKLKVNPEWKIGFTLFSATGNDLKGEDEKLWQSPSDAYLEVQKGDYGNALIYFNGKKGVGEGHSVSNLNYYALFGQYRSPNDEILVNLAMYSFSRNKPVHYGDSGDETTSKNIGKELDFEVFWRLEEKLLCGFFASVLLPGDAYSPDDNIKPTGDQVDFSLLGLNVVYKF